MADARDLKSLIPKGVCGFESRRRHFIIGEFLGLDHPDNSGSRGPCSVAKPKSA